jgi:phytoene synthase
VELYTKTCYELSARLTKRYSTSFSLSSRLFAGSIRPHIYAIYAMVRVADEIVDTYKGDDSLVQLERLEAELTQARASGYSSNPILHAYAQTARRYHIEDALTDAFFASMRMDPMKRTYTQAEYEHYIYGSAEVIGLMCLRVFTDNNKALYARLKDGARALGAAYQKVNFLRDIRADHEELGRMYFPGVSYDEFSEQDKADIIKDIESDFAAAQEALRDLPPSSRRAVRASYDYYRSLLGRLASASVDELTTQRLRVPDWYKVLLLARAGVTR